MFVFGLSACDIRNEQPARPQMSDFGETFKTLTISRLNFIDTHFVSKMGLKEPERTCKMATVQAQLWPFGVPKVSVLYNALIINTYKIENRK